MWTCLKCNAVNEDLYPCCPKCGAGKSAGRFGVCASSRPAVYTQRPAEAKPAAPEPAPEAPPAAPVPVLYEEPDLSKAKDGGMVRFIGRMLMILLPLVTVCWFIAQFSTLSVTLSGAFFKNAEDLSPFIRIPVYVLLAACAALVSALPGLWTLSVGKILNRLARAEALL